nr:transcription factor DYT1 [Tanacetum cinerariifolium]
WPPKVTFGSLLPHARGLGFKPRREGFPSGAKKEWGIYPKAQLNKETIIIDAMIHPEEKMKKWGIESEVVVTDIDENKLWVKIVLEKKLGGFTKLIEALSMLGIELVNISVTTTKGAVLVTSCIVSACCYASSRSDS